MERRQLEYFLAVVEHQSFTTASRSIPLAQPSLSQSIKALEGELGVKLFERHGQGIRLTSAGEALVEPARRTVRDFANAFDAVMDVSGLQRGRLDIVSLPSLGADPMADLLARFHREHPHIHIRLAAPSSSDILDALRLGGSEIGVTIQPLQPSGLTATAFNAEEFSVGLPPDSGVTPGVPFPTSRLGELDLIVAITTKPLMRKILLDNNITPNFTVETGHREAIVPLVLGGVGAALFTPQVARDAARRGAIVCPLDPPMTRQVVMVYRADDLSPAATAFLSLFGGVGTPEVTYLGPGHPIVPVPAGAPS